MQSRSNHSIRTRASSLVLLAILGITALGAGGYYALASSNVSLNNVQINIQTTSSLPYSYDVSVYNTSGSLVSYTQTNFPAAAFMLPSGTYLFTVTAYDYGTYPCNVCMGAGNVVSTPPVKSGGTMIPAIIIGGAGVEYGYTLQQVSGQTSISITTQNTSSISTSTVTVKVTFANGTVASGVSVSAFVVGQSYYWWGTNTSISMSAQTDSQGVASLVVPAAPVEVTASDSVPIILPQNETTVQKVIDGQKINVTVYWEPTYAYLSGSALIIPPQTSASITLLYQPSTVYYYPTPYLSAGSTGSGGVTTTVTNSGQQGSAASTPSSSGATSSQNQYAPASRISPFSLTPTQTTASHQTTKSDSGQGTQSTAAASSGMDLSSSVLLLSVAAIATFVVALTIVFAFRSRKQAVEPKVSAP